MQMIDLMKRLAELDAKKSNNVKQGVAEGDWGWDDPRYDREPPERPDDMDAFKQDRQRRADDAKLDTKKSNNGERGMKEGDWGWDDPQYDRQPPEKPADWDYEQHRQRQIDDPQAYLYDLIIKYFQKYPKRDELKNFVSSKFREIHPGVDPKEVGPAFDHLYKKLVNPDYSVPDDVEVGLNYPRDSQRRGEMGMEEDNSDIDAFLQKGGEIKKLPPGPGPNRPGTSLASSHIGRGGERPGRSTTGKGANTQSPRVAGMREGLDECGIMPASSSMGMPRTPASISITADSGSELSAMLRDIASLAGIKNHHDDGDDAILPGNGSLEIEPLGVEPTDMGPPEPSMRSMIDKLNPSDEKAEETIDSEPDPMSAGKVPANQDPAGTPGAAQGRNQMNNPVATPMPTEDEVYEALRQDYQTFLTDSYRGRSSWDTSSTGWQNREQNRMDADKRAFKYAELQHELGHEDEPYRPTSRYSRPASRGMYFYNVKPGQENSAMQAGLKQSKSGKWYSSSQNSKADELFGKGRYWEPKNEGENFETEGIFEHVEDIVRLSGLAEIAMRKNVKR